MADCTAATSTDNRGWEYIRSGDLMSVFHGGKGADDIGIKKGKCGLLGHNG